MISKTFSFYGEEAEAIMATLRSKDERISALEQQLTDLNNKLEFTEAIVAADNALIAGLKADVADAKKQAVLLRNSLVKLDRLLPCGIETAALKGTLDLNRYKLCNAKPSAVVGTRHTLPITTLNGIVPASVVKEIYQLKDMPDRTQLYETAEI